MKKVLVITGGSRGIGLATCQLFLQHGYRVVNLSRSASPLAEVEQLRVDLGDLDWDARHGPELLRLVGGSDSIALVHNAGMGTADSVASLQVDAMRQVLQINVVASAQLSNLLLPRMGRGSSILYIGSTLSEKAVPGVCSYVLSKHAVIGLMRSTCQDLAGTGIHTACVCPGFTDTEMLREHLGNDSVALQAAAERSVFERLVQPEEIAQTLLFCAQNPAINGTVLHASLGQRED